MSDNETQNKWNEKAVRQNLLLWQLSMSFLKIDKELKKALQSKLQKSDFDY